MRDQNSTKKTRRWPPRVGKRHRQDGHPSPERQPQSELPLSEAPPAQDHSATADRSHSGTIVVSRRSRLRETVAKKRNGDVCVPGG